MTEGIEEGTIIKASWGYDQTNVDWYKCTRRSPQFAWLVRIGAKTYSDGPRTMTGKSEPDPDTEHGRPFRRKVLTDDLTGRQFLMMNAYTTGRPWNGAPAHFNEYG
jgi:hypothetical protein